MIKHDLIVKFMEQILLLALTCFTNDISLLTQCDTEF